MEEEENIDVFGDPPIELRSNENEDYLENFGNHDEEISNK